MVESHPPGISQLMNSRKSDQVKTRAINFRVPESVWQAAAERATLAGKGINGWARDELTGRLDERHGLTPGEQLLYVELNNLRNLVETVLLAGMTAENEERYADALEQSIETRAAAARDYFAQLAEVGQSGGGEKETVS